MIKILANDGISNSGIEKLEKNGFIVNTNKISQENLAEEINSENYEVILVRSATQIRKDIMRIGKKSKPKDKKVQKASLGGSVKATGTFKGTF